MQTFITAYARTLPELTNGIVSALNDFTKKGQPCIILNWQIIEMKEGVIDLDKKDRFYFVGMVEMGELEETKIVPLAKA